MRAVERVKHREIMTKGREGEGVSLSSHFFVKSKVVAKSQHEKSGEQNYLSTDRKNISDQSNNLANNYSSKSLYITQESCFLGKNTNKQ